MARIALISPSENAYSETFIRAHKEQLEGEIYYYYGIKYPVFLDGHGVLANSRYERIFHILKGKFNLNKFSLKEQALIDSLKNNKIDLIFAEYGTTGSKLVKVARYLNLPLVVHFHGYDASINSVISSHKNYKEVFDYASYVIGVSKKMCSDLQELGCSPEKIIYNVYGPAKEFFKAEPTFSKKQFIAIGRFVNKKAPYYLILSFLDVLKKHPDAKLIIAGNGELLNVCKNLRDFYGVKENIDLPGVIKPEEYQLYLKESLAMVQHSVMANNGDCEGTPVAILEASAAGLPVVATKHAGIPDVIIDGKSGLLTDEHDVSGMSKNMLKIIENREMALSLGANGKKNMRNNFTLKRHIDLLNNIIKTSITNKLN